MAQQFQRVQLKIQQDRINMSSMFSAFYPSINEFMLRHSAVINVVNTRTVAGSFLTHL